MNLEVTNLCFGFEKNNYLLKNITFSVRTGEFIVLAGENGSGKSLLMKHLNGLHAPSSGALLFNGKEVSKNKSEVRRKVGLVFQNSDAQFVAQTVYDEMAFGPENLGWEKNEIERKVSHYADIFGITPYLDRHPHFLSGGEKKRIAIAAVMIMRPDLVIFDEPFATLDYKGVISVCNTIVDIYNQGCSVIVITHDLEKILAHATRLMIMKSGMLVYDGKPSLEKRLLLDNNIRVPHGNRRSVESCTWLA
ncbi:MAG TPA: ABC transporter ATP-binding protein [Spirochaetota bacterium]|nr:ABC transporter ATP-binding protein [Spirochaetota bacterium]